MAHNRVDMPIYKPVIYPNGFVKVDGVLIGKITPRKTLQVWDKNKHRARERGSQTVEVKIADLQVLCDMADKLIEGSITHEKN